MEKCASRWLAILGPLVTAIVSGLLGINLSPAWEAVEDWKTATAGAEGAEFYWREAYEDERADHVACVEHLSLLLGGDRSRANVGVENADDH